MIRRVIPRKQLLSNIELNRNVRAFALEHARIRRRQIWLGVACFVTFGFCWEIVVLIDYLLRPQ